MAKKRVKTAMTSDTGSGAFHLPAQNPVAKFSPYFNKVGFFRDRTAYSRKNKHKGIEPFSLLAQAMFNEHRKGLRLFFHAN